MRFSQLSGLPVCITIFSVLTACVGTPPSDDDDEKSLGIANAQESLRRRDDDDPGDPDPDPTPDPDPDPPPPPPPPPPTLDELAAMHSGFDLNGDGIQEIASIRKMNFEPSPPLGSSGSPLALVLVDPRLINNPDTNNLNGSVNEWLRVHRDELVRDGYQVRFFLTEVYSGWKHQDGRTLLALRRFLQSVRAHYPLQGVSLFGNFPEATLFRRALSRRNESDGTHLVLHPERINPRAEIVLADLDGNWESLYQEVADMERIDLRTTASFPHDGQYLTGTVADVSKVHWEDVFFIQDDFARFSSGSTSKGGTATVFIESTAQRNPELSFWDWWQPNPIARPEIIVSRINAKGIAFDPRANVADRYGRQLLAADGRPQALEFTTPTGLHWTVNRLLEQRLIIDFLVRNWTHRWGGEPPDHHRTSSIRQPNSGLISPSSFNNVLRQADPNNFGSSLSVEGSLTAYVNWLKTPAVLRGIAAHSDDTVSVFGLPASPEELDTALGGRVWSWKYTEENGVYRYTPSPAQLGGNWRWEVGRTIWENGLLVHAGQNFFVHGGCSVNVPDGNSHDFSYDDQSYGERKNADSVLFFLNGLGLITRGKVFFDTPSDVGASIRNNGGRFGFGWKGAFFADGNNGALKPGTNGDDRVLANKKSYFWGLRGDWSARLRH